MPSGISAAGAQSESLGVWHAGEQLARLSVVSGHPSSRCVRFFDQAGKTVLQVARGDGEPSSHSHLWLGIFNEPSGTPYQWDPIGVRTSPHVVSASPTLHNGAPRHLTRDSILIPIRGNLS